LTLARHPDQVKKVAVSIPPKRKAAMANLLDDPAACPAPTAAWDIRNLRRCGDPLNALEIIPRSSAHCDLRSTYERTLPVE
ncbi:MAG TPA: hypothetical protein VK638_11205, partial [Edaphobacter sp.]|nr:hypothetical protein [Edaphobacter sp.]